MEKIKVYGYRWVVLVVFMLVSAVMQMHWINFAPITTEAIKFYNLAEIKIALLGMNMTLSPAIQIGIFSMSFMIVFLFMCIPASYVIDTYGLRIGVGIGSVLMAIFAMTKGLYANSYNAILISSFGLAIGQPFLLNAVTKVGAEWFPIQERATAAGLASLSQYIGFVIAMALTPILFKMQGMKGMLMTYGILTVATVVFFLIFAKDSPPTPPTLKKEVRHSVFVGLKHMFKIKDMVLLLILFFIGLGMFNAVTTWIEQLLMPRGINAEQAGLIGAAMIVGGIIGAIIIPILSDIQRKRKFYLVLCMIGIIPGLVGMTFLTNYYHLLAAGFVLGFFIMSAGPIGFQYGAEVSFPTPESTSQGMIILAGQVSGIIFIPIMDMTKDPKTGSMTLSMIAFALLMILSALAAVFMKESTMIMTATELAEKAEGILDKDSAG